MTKGTAPRALAALGSSSGEAVVHRPLALALTLLWILALPALAQAATSTQDFSRLPQVSNPSLSPSGDYLAMEMSYQGGRVLVVRDLYGKEPPAVVAPGDVLLHSYEWVSNDRLILSLRDTATFRGVTFNFIRLVSVDRFGQNLAPLRMKTNLAGFYSAFPHVVSALPGDDEHILAVLNDRPDRFNYPEVDRVNIVTGRSERIQENDRAIVQWMADGQGRLRLGVAFNYKGRGQRGREVMIYHRRDDDSEWETLQTGDVFDEDLIYPVRFDVADPNVLLVSSREIQDQVRAQETLELYRYDITKRKLLGRFEEPALAALEDRVRSQHDLARAFVVSASDDGERVIVKAFSDVKPPRFYLYEKTLDRLSYLGGEYPQLETLALATMQETAYTARDGREIPAFLTLPNNHQPGKTPLLVYPHGGPWARDYWGFDNYVQYFASQGYAVLQPQFRGSTGFGNEHEAAGYGEWGFAIQDDITDGVKWLIDSGVVDADRICIYGASFGGYAAAVGAATTPELYQCAITENGVLDLRRFLDDANELVFEDSNRAVFNDWSTAKSASPYHLYAQIRVPMLIIASENDTVVPYKSHSQRFFKKLKRTKTPVQWLLLEQGEHWRSNEEHERMKLESIGAFLDAHIGAR